MIGRFRTPEIDVSEDRPRGFDDFDLRLGDVMRGERATLGKSLLDVQRELKIKATYIAAIEKADPTAFETPGFIAGYVRSYARYLGLDPEWAYRAFCAEGNFETVHGMSQAASGKRPEPRIPQPEKRDPFADPRFSFTPAREAFVSRIEPGAVGSTLVLVALIGVIGYGGFSVLKEIQKVQFVPVEQTPIVAADLDPLAAARSLPEPGEEGAGIAAAAPDRFDRLYRPQALDVPVLVARDGPIAALDPASVGNLAPGQGSERGREAVHGSALARADGTPAPDADRTPASQADAIAQAIAQAQADLPGAGTGAGAGADRAGGPADAVRVVADQAPEVALFAVRPSWVRVRAADGTVLLEKILEPGDRFVLPRTEEPATLRTGESGAIYFAVDGQTYGPAGRAGQVTSNVKLAAAELRDAYQMADLTKDADLRTYVAELGALPPERPAE